MALQLAIPAGFSALAGSLSTLIAGGYAETNRRLATGESERTALKSLWDLLDEHVQDQLDVLESGVGHQPTPEARVERQAKVKVLRVRIKAVKAGLAWGLYNAGGDNKSQIEAYKAGSEHLSAMWISAGNPGQGGTWGSGAPAPSNVNAARLAMAKSGRYAGHPDSQSQSSSQATKNQWYGNLASAARYTPSGPSTAAQRSSQTLHIVSGRYASQSQASAAPFHPPEQPQASGIQQSGTYASSRHRERREDVGSWAEGTTTSYPMSATPLPQRDAGLSEPAYPPELPQVSGSQPPGTYDSAAQRTRRGDESKRASGYNTSYQTPGNAQAQGYAATSEPSYYQSPQAPRSQVLGASANGRTPAVPSGYPSGRRDARSTAQSYKLTRPEYTPQPSESSYDRTARPSYNFYSDNPYSDNP